MGWVPYFLLVSEVEAVLFGPVTSPVGSAPTLGGYGQSRAMGRRVAIRAVPSEGRALSESGHGMPGDRQGSALRGQGTVRVRPWDTG